MNIGRKIAKSQIKNKPNSTTKKSLYIQIALAEYFHHINGSPTEDENEKIKMQGSHAINELKKLLILLKNPLNIIQPEWKDLSPEGACKISKILKIECKIHSLWELMNEIAEEQIKNCISEIENAI